ncbi:class II aldolase/adducin family protein [Halioxenophilus sp. WMMB6]|uniref:class II aldolase/adducin family protein n=1 Tax=Halioxenophilus sp. WMMB6 TaxID=3073815 RepID=UPI00295F54D5|nr:class II aldolase/adducin family protein [Halioxenophilus sp. WMMB6]
MSATEKELRIQLAACYRIFAHLGWDELIFNHITVKIPETDHHFLINPYGLHYSEVTASNLIKVDINGQQLDDSPYRPNPAGMVIHSAVHAAREDVICIGHLHTDAGSVVACQQEGLRTDNFYSVLLHKQVAYHDFEGLTVVAGEKERLVNSLGTKNFLILRNHGILTCGRSIPEMFSNLWILQRACEIQVAADSSGRPLIPIADDIADKSFELLSIQTAGAPSGALEFSAMQRIVDRIDSSYRDL